MYFKVIYTFLFLFTFSLGTLSCTDDKKDLNELKPTEKAFNKNFEIKNGRLVFANNEAMSKTLNELINKSVEEMDRWELSNGFSSYRTYLKAVNYEDRNYTDMPYYFATILNAKGEYQIGDSIMWIANNIEYMIPNTDESLLRKIQNNPAEAPFQVYRHTLIRTIPITISDESSTPQARYIYGVEAKYQPEYNVQGLRKFVYELQEVDSSSETALVLRSKHEYRNSKGQWRPAGETVRKDIRNVRFYGYTPSTCNGMILSGPHTAPTQTGSSYMEYVVIRDLKNPNEPDCDIKFNFQYVTADFQSTVLSSYYYDYVLNGANW